MDQLPRLGKRELICLLSFTCNYVVFVWRGFLFLWMLGMGYVILLWHSLSLPYNYSIFIYKNENIRNKIKAHKTSNGVGYTCTNKMTRISTANYPRLQNLVPNEC